MVKSFKDMPVEFYRKLYEIDPDLVFIPDDKTYAMIDLKAVAGRLEATNLLRIYQATMMMEDRA